MAQREIIDISGIGPHTAKVLADRGIGSVDALAALSTEELAALPGFGPSRASALGRALAQLHQPTNTNNKKNKNHNKADNTGNKKGKDTNDTKKKKTQGKGKGKGKGKGNGKKRK